MKFKFIYDHLAVAVKDLQAAEDRIQFSNDFERKITLEIIKELTETFLIKLIKKKNEYQISLKSYHIMALQVAIFWSDEKCEYHINAVRQIMAITDQVLVNKGLK